jgi:uncharacterized protein YecE (DUF72 family)
MSAIIRIGTASWTDKSLVQSKRFYPKGCSSAEDRLRHYAGEFPLVEVDSSYYALPSIGNSSKWVERTPDDFEFDIKAFRLFTGHQTPKIALPVDIQAALAAHFAAKPMLYYKDTPAEIRDELWARYEQAIRPLRQAGKLQAVLFQFPKWVLPGERAWEHIDECIERLAGYQLATEFRQRTWFDAKHLGDTLERERERGLVHVTVDAPPDKASAIPTVWAVTNPKLGIFRLHGRNVATWDDKSAQAASDRFNYDYSDDELEQIAEGVGEIAAGLERLHIIFNNNYEDQGQRNAKSLKRIIRDGVYKRPRRQDLLGAD